MASLGKLPAETLLQVLRDLGIRDLAAIAATCRWLYALANPMLYKLDVQNLESYTFYAAAGSGHVGRMQKLIDAGFDVNQTWFSPFSGPCFEGIKIMNLGRKGRCSRKAVMLNLQAAGKRFIQATQTRYQFAYDRGHFPDDDDEEEVDSSDSEADNFDSEADSSDSEEDETESDLGTSRRPQDVENHCYWTALHVAAANGQDEAVSFLIDRGANINAPSKDYCECRQIIAHLTSGYHSRSPPPIWSPLHIAICRGYFPVVRQLLIRGASIFVEVNGLDELKCQSGGVGTDISVAATNPTTTLQGQGRCTALHVACYHGFYKLVMTLIEDGYQSELEVKDRFGQTPFVYAFWAQQFDAIIPYLHSKGCNINITLGQHSGLSTGSCLIMACRAYQYDDAIKLVELGVDVNSLEFQTDDSPLHICACSYPARDERTGKKRYKLARKLLKAGASLISENDAGYTPVFSAVSNLDTQMTKILIRHGADVSGRDVSGNTVLSEFCRDWEGLTWSAYGEQAFISMVDLLVTPEADINARNHEHLTALHNACDIDEPCAALPTFLKILIRRGASVTLRDGSGLLPFHTAFLKGWLDVCLVLFNEQVKTLLTKDDITDMFLALLDLPDNLIPDLFNLLLDAGGRFLLMQPDILKMALDYKATCLLPLLVSKRTLANFVSNSSETVLHLGCQSGMFEGEIVIAQLLESGVEFDGDITNQDGSTLLYTYFVAAQNRAWKKPSRSMITKLLKRGANPHQIVKQISSDYHHPDYSQCERPLDVVIGDCQFDLAHRILKRYHIQGDRSGCSYLHRSCSFQMAPADERLVRYLLRLGCDPNGISCFGETPLFHMLHTFQPGLPSKYSSYSGRKPFMAVKHIDILMNCIRILENHGAKWSVRNKYPRDGRWTPIDELRHLLSYDGEHSRSRAELTRLRENFTRKKWDIEDVGENFSLFEQD